MESQTYRTGEGSGGAAAYPGAGASPATGQQRPDGERNKEEAKREVQAAKDEVRNAAQQAKQHAGEVGRQVKDTTRQAAEQTKRKATEYAERARTRGVEMLDEQRHSAAAQIQTVGDAVRRAAGKFREEKDENIAGYVDAAADEVDRFARYLEQRDMGSLVRDAQQLARRNPEWFLGGMFLAGLALSRFLKASSRPEPSAQSQEYMSQRGRSPGIGPWGEDYDAGRASMSQSGGLPAASGFGDTGTGVAGMPGSAASETTTLPPSIGESGPACGPIEQQ